MQWFQLRSDFRDTQWSFGELHDVNLQILKIAISSSNFVNFRVVINGINQQVYQVNCCRTWFIRSWLPTGRDNRHRVLSPYTLLTFPMHLSQTIVNDPNRSCINTKRLFLLTYTMQKRCTLYWNIIMQHGSNNILWFFREMTVKLCHSQPNTWANQYFCSVPSSVG